MINPLVDVNEFPGLFNDGKQLVYLDSAATSQKHKSVINQLYKSAGELYSTTGRTVYQKSLSISEKCEQVRAKIGSFISCKPEEVIFTSGATHSINMFANSITFEAGKKRILVTELEHHSNLLPWQLLAERHGIKLEKIPLLESGEIDFNKFVEIMEHDVFIVSVSYIYNMSGIEVDIKRISDITSKYGAILFVDAAQAVGHRVIDVKAMGCDALCFSAHKMYGPNGVGILYYSKNIVHRMKPFFVGGGMVQSVSFNNFEPLPPPQCFEAGTLPIPEIIAFGTAVDLINEISLKNIYEHSKKLSLELKKRLTELGFVKFVYDSHSHILSFNLEGVHALDVSVMLDCENICVRSGDLCSKGSLNFYSLESVLRVSFGIYNSEHDINAIVNALQKIYINLSK